MMLGSPSMMAQQLFQAWPPRGYDSPCFHLQPPSLADWDDESHPQQQQQQEQQQQHWEEGEDDDRQQKQPPPPTLEAMLDESSCYFDSLSPPRTPLRDEVPLVDSNDTSDWMESLMSELAQSDDHLEQPHVQDQQEQQQQQQQQEQAQSSDNTTVYPCTPDDIWRDHFGLNLPAPPATQGGTATDVAGDVAVASVVSMLHAWVAERDPTTLAGLREVSSLVGDTSQRVAAHFCDAIDAVSIGSSGGGGDSDGGGDSEATTAAAYKTIDDAVPYLRFAHLTANQALLEATEGATRVHIVDFGTTSGLQWASLMQSFGGRSLRITAVGFASVADAGRRLSEFAAAAGVADFSFSHVAARLDELRAEDIPAHPGEAAAANVGLHMPLSPAALRRVLAAVQRLNPRVVTVAEFETGGGDGGRVVGIGALQAAVFESLDVAGLRRDDPSRVAAERHLLGPPVRSGVAAAMAAAEMAEAAEAGDIGGLWSAPISHYTASQARQLLWLYPACATDSAGSSSFSLTHAAGCLTLCWRRRPVVTVSAWHC